jgi:hypothetical protein
MTKPLKTSPSCVGSFLEEIEASMDHSKSHHSLRAQVADAHDDKQETESYSTRLAGAGFPLYETRSLILRLTVLVGNLCFLVLQTIPLDPAMGVVARTTTIKAEDGRRATTSKSIGHAANSEVRKALSQILACLLDVSASASINLETAILKKMELNRRKYPVDLCKV